MTSNDGYLFRVDPAKVQTDEDINDDMADGMDLDDDQQLNNLDDDDNEDNQDAD